MRVGSEKQDSTFKLNHSPDHPLYGSLHKLNPSPRLKAVSNESRLHPVSTKDRVSQTDVSKLMSGRHAGYSVGRLMTLLNGLDVDIDIVVRPRELARPDRSGTVRVVGTAPAA